MYFLLLFTHDIGKTYTIYGIPYMVCHRGIPVYHHTYMVYNPDLKFSRTSIITFPHHNYFDCLLYCRRLFIYCKPKLLSYPI